jgi:dTDP-4-amino-4,6-dideoxygalactose transaminase
LGALETSQHKVFVVNNQKYIERAEIIREKGTNRSKFMRGEVQKYQWVDQGSSYLLAESLAGILLGQLESFDFILQSRYETVQKYLAINFGDMCKINSQEALNVAHMFYLEFNDSENAEIFLDFMKEQGINVSSHYQSLHSSTYGAQISKGGNSFINSQKTSKALLRIPLWFGMDEKDVDFIISKSNQILTIMKERKSSENC